MRSIRSITKTILLLSLFFSEGSWAQTSWSFLDQGSSSGLDFLKIPTLNIRRSGPYIGLIRGKYNVLEFGYEMQWNKVSLRKPITHAGHMGFDYNFLRNVLGYDVGYWCKVGRLDLTYGGNIIFRSDFERSAFGFAPIVGFKFWQLHLQTGYHFLTRPARDMETNTLFVSLRYVFINDRDWTWKKKDKKKQ